MPYPDDLLSKSYYKKIDISSLPPDSYLVRRSSKSRSDTFDRLGVVRTDAFFNKDDPPDAYYRLYDLSTNLLGVFKVPHLKYVIPHSKNPKWVPTDNPSIPPLKDDEYTEEKGDVVPIFLPIHDINGIELPYTDPNTKPKNSSETAICEVAHDPLWYNFWHYELHFKKPSGELIRPTASVWRTNAAKHVMNSDLKRLSRAEEPNIDVLNESLYTKPSYSAAKSNVLAPNQTLIKRILPVAVLAIGGLLIIKGLSVVHRKLSRMFDQHI